MYDVLSEQVYLDSGVFNYELYNVHAYMRTEFYGQVFLGGGGE